MASPTVIKQLQVTAEAFEKIDRIRLLRKSIGEESLEEFIQPLLNELARKLEFAKQYAPQVHDTYVEHARSQFQAATNELVAQAARPTPDYIANKANLLAQLQSYLTALDVHWAPFVAAAVDARGFLQDEGIKQEYEKTVSRMQGEATATLENIRKESNAAIEEARKLAEQIEARARRTATRISVDVAQAQFKEAQKSMRNFVVLWSILTVISLGVLGVLLYIFLRVNLPEQWSWQVAYYAAIRFAALATVGSVAAYCLRVLRAQLHQYQFNLHRQRVTNSIGAFVESAVTPEQRDLILGHLVESVVHFGNSGLLDHEGSMDGLTPKLTVDNITRAFLQPHKEPTSK